MGDDRKAKGVRVMKGRVVKRILWGLVLAVLVLGAAVGLYVGYVAVQYNRIPDGEKLTVENPRSRSALNARSFTLP